MARINKVEACIFCGSLPCACNKSDKPGRAAKPKAKETQPAKPKSRFKAGVPKPEKPATPAEPVAPASKFTVDTEPKTESQDELELKQAIRNLEPILAPSERNRYRNILKPMTGSIERRLWEWRERNAKS